MPSILITAPAGEPLSVLEAKLDRRLTDTGQDALLPVMITHARRAAETICRRVLLMQQMKLVLDGFPRPAMNISSANWYGPQWGTMPGPLSTVRVDGKTGFEIVLPHPPLQSVASIKYVDADTGILTTLDASQYLVDGTTEPARVTPAYNTTWPSTRNQTNAVEVTYLAGYASPFTVATSTLTLLGPHKTYAADDVIRLTSSGATAGGDLPAPLKAQTDYYVKSPSGATLQLAATAGGSAITITGTIASGAICMIGDARIDDLDGIKLWMRARIGSVFENREEVAILHRGLVGELPYVDRLLDPYRVITY